jgi:hypothetical protein
LQNHAITNELWQADIGKAGKGNNAVKRIKTSTITLLIPRENFIDGFSTGPDGTHSEPVIIFKQCQEYISTCAFF